MESSKFYEGTRDGALKVMAESAMKGSADAAQKHWRTAVHFNRSRKRLARREERLKWL